MKKVICSIIFIYTTLFAKSEIDNEFDIRGEVIDGYHTFLNTIDCFISGYDDINGSNYKQIAKNSFHLNFSIKNSKDIPFKITPSFRARVKLPQIQRKLELTFSQESIDNIDNRNIDGVYDKTPEDKKFRMGLKYYFFKEKNSIGYAKLSLKFSSFNIYGKVGFSRSYFYKNIHIVLDSRFYYYISTKDFTLSLMSIFSKPLGDSFVVSQKNVLSFDKNGKLEHNIALHQYINRENRFSYQLFYTTIQKGIGCKYCKDRYGANINIHHQATEWLFFEIIPQVYRRRENSFMFEKAIDINFGIKFSK